MLKTDIRTRFAEGKFNPSTHTEEKLQSPTFVRMAVLDVISDPNSDNVNEEKKQQWHEMHVMNMQYADVLPRNTIVAKRVGEETDPLFVFPFFPSHLSLPCKPGECVWAMIENPEALSIEVAYWFCRIVEPHISDDVNHAHPGRSFEISMTPGTKERLENEVNGTAESGENVWHELRNGPVHKDGVDRVTSGQGIILKGEPEDIFERLITESNAARLMSYESVPRFRKRPSDIAIEGSNNALIVLGTDRAGSVDYSLSDWRSDAGAIDIVAGRGQTEATGGKKASTTSIKNAVGNTKGTEIKKELNKSPDVLSESEGDPDLKNDRSRVLVSQRTSADNNFKLSEYNGKLSVSDSTNGDSAVVIKTDKVRVLARSDAQILVTGFTPTEVKDSQFARKDESEDQKTWASITVNSNGDIILKPSDKGYIKMGDETADRALVCTDLPAVTADGKVLASTPSLTNTMGGKFGGTGIPTQGTWAKKILVTGAK